VVSSVICDRSSFPLLMHV